MVRTFKDWYMLRILKGNKGNIECQKLWECYQQLISNPSEPVVYSP